MTDKLQDLIDHVYEYRLLLGLSDEWSDFEFSVEVCCHAGATDKNNKPFRSQDVVFCATVMADRNKVENDDLSGVFHCCDLDPSTALRRALVDYLKAAPTRLPTDVKIKLKNASDKG